MRRALRLAHRWAGLAAAAVLLVSGLTGAALLVAAPLDARLNAALFSSGLGASQRLPAAALDAAHARLAAEFLGATLTYRLPREPAESLKVYVRGGTWDGEVYFDGRGAELGRRGQTEGFFNLLFELHSTLVSKDLGRTALFAAALAYLVLLGAGLVLWWPRRLDRAAFRIARHVGWKRTLWDLHRVGGAVLGVGVLVPVSSGAYMAWRPLSTAVDALAGTAAVAAPPRVAPAPAPAAGTMPLPVSALVAAAERALPEGRTAIVQWSPQPSRAVRVRKQLDDEVHPNGLTAVWLHPATGQVLRVTPWRKASAAQLGFQFIYPLHTGALGGTAHAWAAGAAGLALAALGASGPVLWFVRRRRARRPTPADVGEAARTAYSAARQASHDPR